MANFNIGDQIEILYHENPAYSGVRGKVMFVGTSLRQGTDMLENNINLPDQDPRFIVALDNSTIVSNLREVQLKKL
jgi:hypothetical protein